MRVEWTSFAIGAAVATGLLVGGFFLTGEETSPSVARSARSHATPGDLGRSPEDASGREEAVAEGGMVRWLSSRLEDAYRQAALPEIVGVDAGRIAGEQAMDYVYEDYDAEEIDSELAAAFEALDDEDGPWRVRYRSWDCAEAPCVLRMDLGRPDGGAIEDCPAALKSALAVLDQAVPAAALDYFGANTGGGRCWTEFRVMTLRSGRRSAEIEAGVQGWLERTKPRTTELAPTSETVQ